MTTGAETIECLQNILQENSTLSRSLDERQIDNALAAIQKAKRIFFAGTGRSGLALKMGAMRFMHLGLRVYVAGETVTPAIQKDDLLIAASGSGSTATVILAAEKAKKQGAEILAVTTDDSSPLGRLADYPIVINAAKKTDFDTNLSAQYAGSLFEQFVLFLSDALFAVLWKHSALPKETLWTRHANLE